MTHPACKPAEIKYEEVEDGDEYGEVDEDDFV